MAEFSSSQTQDIIGLRLQFLASHDQKPAMVPFHRVAHDIAVGLTRVSKQEDKRGQYL
jgi:hypothetical protein